MSYLSRGIRNHNPGNIRWGDNWHGLVPVAERTDTSFCQFVCAAYGIRAIIIILNKYQSKHGLKTIYEIINRWAPAIENDVDKYADYVAKRLGIAVDSEIELSHKSIMVEIIKAIIFFENGCQPYNDEVYKESFELA
ncbi:structural protein [Rosenbergiella sp. S61]|uniref:Structural protein n=1 Tax=Rosenbergiella gaditana TaxID=2726987 RepID=A0ABS5SXW5_9GAMM|nr:structural protein [Rosenbergiella gaditana]MBT0724889.1 structural protein [Rosenbergiella gaditana]